MDSEFPYVFSPNSTSFKQALFLLQQTTGRSYRNNDSVGNAGDVSVLQLVTVKLEEQGICAVSTSDSEERPEEVSSPSESSDERER